MDLRQMRYFVTVVEERNFTRAAERLHMAQPPLSRQIQLLEEELGVQLLVRRSRPLRLTDAGRVFNEQALQILARVEQMKAATRRTGLGEHRVLSIGFVPSTLYGGLPVLLRRIRERRPDLEVQLVEVMSTEQAKALRQGRVDVAFGRLRAEDPATRRIVLREERLVAALPSSNPLAAASGPMSLAELAPWPLIVYPREPRPSYADQVLSLLADRGLRPVQVHEVREIQAALGLVAADVGVCLIPGSARLLRPELHYRDLDDPGAVSPIILSHRMHDRSPELQMVKDELARMLQADGEHQAVASLRD